MVEEYSPTYLAIIIVIVVIILILAFWILGVYNAQFPGPSVPDSDFSRLIGEYRSYPKELWFRDNPCVFNKWLLCRPYRFIIYDSNSDIIYDSADHKEWKYRPPVVENAEKLKNSVEYIRAASLTQGVVLRDTCPGQTANVAELAKDGDYYRIVHISEYVYDTCDPEF